MRQLREATEDQADLVAEILADSFRDDPVWSWVFPDPAGRAAVLPRFFRTYVRQALVDGQALIAGPDLGAALWIRVGVEPDSDESGEREGRGEQEDEGDELPAVYGPYLDRMATIDELLREAHPRHVEHLYLPLIGVRPHARGAGLGSALLTHRPDRRAVANQPAANHPAANQAAEEGPAYPAYLEASSERNKALYERHGFRCLGKPIRLPDGPTLHPMWREPNR